MSERLQTIIDQQHGKFVVTAVFIDIVKYSLRRSAMQKRIIDRFNRAIVGALDKVQGLHDESANQKGIDLHADVIKIPTGDGIAVVFCFQGMHAIPIDFATEFMSCGASNRAKISCDHFGQHGWCDCHEDYEVRIGIAEGNAILYRDVNNQLNVAGNAINIASRIMGLADRQQILMTKGAYDNLIDLADDLTLLQGRFRHHGKHVVKHNVEVEVCQLVGSEDGLINDGVPSQIELSRASPGGRRLASTPSSLTSAPALDVGRLLDNIERLPRHQAKLQALEGALKTILDVLATSQDDTPNERDRKPRRRSRLGFRSVPAVSGLSSADGDPVRSSP